MLMNQKKICDPNTDADKANRSHLIKKCFSLAQREPAEGFLPREHPLSYEIAWSPPGWQHRGITKPILPQGLLSLGEVSQPWTDTGTPLSSCETQIQALLKMLQTFQTKLQSKD